MAEVAQYACVYNCNREFQRQKQLLRSSAIPTAGSQTIAELSAICDLRSSAIIRKSALKYLIMKSS